MRRSNKSSAIFVYKIRNEVSCSDRQTRKAVATLGLENAFNLFIFLLFWFATKCQVNNNRLVLSMVWVWIYSSNV